jgi:hypothetical protein
MRLISWTLRSGSEHYLQIRIYISHLGKYIRVHMSSGKLALQSTVQSIVIM